MPSLLQGGVLNTPGGIRGDTRLALTEAGTIRADGRQPIGNLFARAWDCITRSPEKVAANKALARSFVSELRERYGDVAAGMASRELKAHLTLGRPLTAYRFARVLEQAVQLQERSVAKENTAWLRGQGLSTRDIRDIKAQFSHQELTLLRKADLSIAMGRQYKEQQIPIHPRTLLTHHRDENVVGKPEELRGGAMSKPYLVNYRDDPNPVVFKEANPSEGLGDAALALGINRNDSRMAVRNIATTAVDKLLGFNLTPDTRIGMLGGALGVVMSFADGVPAMKQREVDVTEEMGEQVHTWQEQCYGAEDLFNDLLTAANLRIDGDRIFQTRPVGVQQSYADPGLRRELVKLQLLDALTAQGDRHGGNYLIRQDDSGRFSGLTAIDNDQSFGTRITDPNQLLNSSQHDVSDRDGNPVGNTAFHGVMLPPVVDAEIKTVFKNLTDFELRGVLNGLLPKAEIEAAVTRLHAIQNHLDNSPPLVVLAGAGPEHWSTEQAGQLLSDPATSYVGRDLQILENIDTTLNYNGTMISHKEVNQ